MPKKFYIKTFGCQMNVRDSEFVVGILLERGFSIADSVNDADIILFNSCSVREHAEDRLISNIADLNRIKKKRPEMIVGLMGCTAQNYKEKMIKRLPILDFVCGPGNEADIPKIIDDVIKNRCEIIAVDKVDKPREELFPRYRENKFKAFVSISEGCDNYCSYCIVPFVRGVERSRKPGDIIKEVKDLADRGYKEITLLGQNVNSYKGARVKGQGSSFVELLKKINDVKGIERIRFMTSHPKDASTDLFMAMRDLKKVCEHLHLPLQSGSDKILKAMNRKYTSSKYLKLVSEYRKFVPDGSITTDVIVGFPGEKDDDFKDTVDIMKKVGFDSAFTFKYSPRPPARSAMLDDDVAQEEKDRRLKILIDLQCEISKAKNEPLCGKIMEVLADGKHDKGSGILTGRTRTNKAVVFKADKGLVGKLVDIKIESIKPYTLSGRMV